MDGASKKEREKIKVLVWPVVAVSTNGSNLINGFGHGPGSST